MSIGLLSNMCMVSAEERMCCEQEAKINCEVNQCEEPAEENKNKEVKVTSAVSC